jgi:hypothetical protein
VEADLCLWQRNVTLFAIDIWAIEVVDLAVENGDFP